MQTYSPLQKWLHWLHAGLIIPLIIIGLLMVRMGEGALTNTFYEAHKSLGILVFCLILVRIPVRLAVGVPPHAEDDHPVLYFMAKAVQTIIYALLVIVPVLGYVATSICCKPVMLFGLIRMPLEWQGSEDLMKTLFTWHELSAITLSLLLCGHIAMAFYHRLIRRDGVFGRMV